MFKALKKKATRKLFDSVPLMLLQVITSFQWKLDQATHSSSLSLLMACLIE